MGQGADGGQNAETGLPKFSGQVGVVSCKADRQVGEVAEQGAVGGQNGAADPPTRGGQEGVEFGQMAKEGKNETARQVGEVTGQEAGMRQNAAASLPTCVLS